MSAKKKTAKKASKNVKSKKAATKSKAVAKPAAPKRRKPAAAKPKGSSKPANDTSKHEQLAESVKQVIVSSDTPLAISDIAKRLKMIRVDEQLPSHLAAQLRRALDNLRATKAIVRTGRARGVRYSAA